MICYKKNTAYSTDIFKYFKECEFEPKIETYTKINDYIEKILKYSERFEVWNDNILIGLAAVYFNNCQKHEGFITNLGIDSSYVGRGLATNLLNQVFEFGKKNGFLKINLEVYLSNKTAINFYLKNGFKIENINDLKIFMCIFL